MKDHHLRALIKVADEGSIRAAARAMHLSQSALTKSLRELEQDVGTQLLRRTSRGVLFTDAGELLIARARLAHSILEKARDAIGTGSMSATVRISVNSSIYGSAIAKVLAEFGRRRPDARVSMSEMLAVDSLQRLRDGSLDFAVGVNDPGFVRDGIVQEKLASASVSVVCRNGHPLAHATQWGSLAHCNWLLNCRPGASGSMFLAWMREQEFFSPRVAVDVASNFLSAELLQHSDHLAVMPVQILSSHLTQGLCQIPLMPPLPQFDVGILRAAGIPISAAANELKAIFGKYLAVEETDCGEGRSFVPTSRKVP